MKVGILFGSRSDTDRMKGAARCLEEFDIPWEAHVLSAHRVPDELEKELARMQAEGVKVFICGAGLAAHLPGVVASKTNPAGNRSAHFGQNQWIGRTVFHRPDAQADSGWHVWESTMHSTRGCWRFRCWHWGMMTSHAVWLNGVKK
jgi:hypothetical protein